MVFLAFAGVLCMDTLCMDTQNWDSIAQKGALRELLRFTSAGARM